MKLKLCRNCEIQKKNTKTLGPTWSISMEAVASANGTINHAGHHMCHILEQHILFISTWHKISLSHQPRFLFLQQEYLQAALQDNGAQLPRAKSTVALTNVVFTEQETLCSHIRVKYLLFISGREKSKREKEGKRERESQSDQDRQRGGEVSRRLWRHCETFHDNRAGVLGTISPYVPIRNVTCQARNCEVRRCSCIMTYILFLTQRWVANAILCSSDVFKLTILKYWKTFSLHELQWRFWIKAEKSQYYNI